MHGNVARAVKTGKATKDETNEVFAAKNLENLDCVFYFSWEEETPQIKKHISKRLISWFQNISKTHTRPPMRTYHKLDTKKFK